MDDIQLIIYLVVGAIYVLSRILRGKEKKPPRPSRPPSPGRETAKNPSEVMTFEEILQEFGKKVSGSQEEEVVAQEYEIQPENEKMIVQDKPETPAQEGVTRRFADEESRKVYEESIKMAEGYDIEFKPDQHFMKSGLKTGFAAYQDKEEENAFVADLKSSLSNPESARKAVVLAEILNRRY